MLLIEYEPFQGNILIDEKLNEFSSRMIVSGLYQMGNVRNRNGRLYPNPLWERRIAPGSELQRRVSRRSVTGEMAHPKDGRGYYPNASHLLTRLWTSYDPQKMCEACDQGVPNHIHVLGEEEILDTPHGLVLQEFYRRNMEVGISSRGSGSLKHVHGRNESIVQEDFRCKTWDHVEDPSTPGCWPKAVNEAALDVIAPMADMSCDPVALTQWKRILEQVILTEETEVLRAKTKDLIEEIDRKLASPVCIAAAKQFAITESLYPFTPYSTEDIVDTVLEEIQTLEEATVPLHPVYKEPLEPTSTSESTNDNDATEIKEVRMDVNSPEFRALVQKAVDEQLAVARQDLQEELTAALSLNRRHESKIQELEKDIAAADKVGQELTTRLTEAEFKGKSYKSWIENRLQEDQANNSTSDVTRLTGQLDKSKGVITEMADRLRNAKIWERKAQIGVHLLAETRKREHRRGLMEHVESLLQYIPESVRETLKPELLRCSSIGEVNRLWGTAKRTIGTLSEARVPANGGRPAVRTEGRMPKAGEINEDTELETGRSLPASRAAGEGDGSVNEQVAEARKLTKSLVSRMSGTTSSNGRAA